MKSSLSPKELAEVVGVSESSLKRWADAGRLKVTRTAGGHRRITVASAIRFIRESHLPLMRPDLLGLKELIAAPSLGAAAPTSQEDLVTLLYTAATTSDEAAFRSSILSRFFAGDRVSMLVDGPIRTVLERVGNLWKQSPRGIAIEHQTANWCVAILNQIRATIEDAADTQEERPRAMGACAPRDLHLIPSLAAATVLAECGWQSRNFGADLPLESLIQVVSEEKPQLIWLSFSDAVTADGSIQALVQPLIAAAQDATAVLVLGGRGWAALGGNPPGGIRIVDSMAGLETLADEIQPRR